MNPEKVPQVLKTNINLKVLGLILTGVIAFQTFLYFASEFEGVEDVVSYLSMSTPLLVAGGSIFIASRYGMSEVFGKSYLFFGIAYFLVFLAEVTYYAYDIIYEIDPYPSIADVFFFSLYPLLVLHIVINLRFFRSKTNTKQKAVFIAIPIIIISIYSIVSLEEIGEPNFDYFYGVIFVSGTSVVLSLAALGAIVFRGGLLGIAWLLLLIGVFIFAIGDVWYYYLEIFGEYDLLHPVNLFWYASDWIIVYALYKHSKAI